MTHMRQMDESEGDLNKPKPTGKPCPGCGSGQELHQTWESSDGGYVDDKYSCSNATCSYTRWVDGIDS